MLAHFCNVYRAIARMKDPTPPSMVMWIKPSQVAVLAFQLSPKVGDGYENPGAATGGFELTTFQSVVRYLSHCAIQISASPRDYLPKDIGCPLHGIIDVYIVLPRIYDT